MRSELLLNEWRGDVSVFSGQLRTMPETMDSELTVEMLAAQMCPPAPFVTADKANALYALACVLREAPLVSKTLERAKARGLPEYGFMRSGGHVTEGRWIKLDLDGIGKDLTLEIIVTLDGLGIGYLLYSTHSHGLKPRNRLRLILFLDRALSPSEYKRASQGAAIWLLGESLDPSEGGLHQLAGVLMCHPDRRAKVFRLVEIGGNRCCVSADALMALAPEPAKARSYSSTVATIVGKSKIGDALRCVDANDTGTWVKVGMALKALEPELGSDALGHWLSFSESADDESKANNADDRYNPLMMWQSFTPSMEVQAAMGVLMGMAKRGAADVLHGDLQSGELSKRGREAVTYLEERHPHFLSLLLAEAGIGGGA